MTSKGTMTLENATSATSGPINSMQVRSSWSRRIHTALTGPAAGIFALMALLISLWSLATPLMGVPDEPAHTIKAAAVARGQIVPEPGTSFGHGVHVQVPSYIANTQAQMCFAFNPSTTAGCAAPIAADDTYVTIGVTSAGQYNPLYYWLVGWPSLILSGSPAIYAMRIVSGLISAAFYAAGFAALLRLRHPKWPVLAASIGTTPMVLFLCAGINPNSLEVSAVMAVFCTMLLLLENSQRLGSMKAPIATAGVSIAVLANTRNVSLVWVLVAAVVAVVFYGLPKLGDLFRNKAVLVSVGLALAGVALGLGWMLLMSMAPPSTGIAPASIATSDETARPYQSFIIMIDRSFDFVIQYIGVMGWLDTIVPQGVLIFWGTLLTALTLLALGARPRRNVFGFWVAAGALLLVPALVQASLASSVGQIWQGRYNLPLFIITMISAGMALRPRRFPTRPGSASIARAFFITGGISHVIAFLFVLRRYVVGIRGNANWQTLFTNPDWQPPLGWPLLTTVYAGLMALGMTALYRFLFPRSGVKTILWKRIVP